MATTTKTYIVPTIGTKGRFTFSKPYDNEKYNGREYQVTAIRELKELSDSGEKPYETIYQIMSISQSEYEEDLTENVPVLVLTDEAGKYLYVPADLVSGMPDITGVKYQEIILAASLGLVPLNTNLEELKKDVIETITEKFGVKTTVEEVRGSAIKYVDDETHKKYQRLLKLEKANTFTYKARCRSLEEINKELTEKYKELEAYVINKIETGGTIDKADFE